MNTEAKRKRNVLLAAYIIAAVLSFAISLLAVCPYKIVASPNSKFHIVDEARRPLAGLRVVRQWDTSEDPEGEKTRL